MLGFWFVAVFKPRHVLLPKYLHALFEWHWGLLLFAAANDTEKPDLLDEVGRYVVFRKQVGDVTINRLAAHAMQISLEAFLVAVVPNLQYDVN